MRFSMICVSALCLTLTGCLMETMDPDDPRVRDDPRAWNLQPASPDESGAGKGGVRAQPMSLDDDGYFVPPEQPPEDEEPGEETEPREVVDREVAPLQRTGRPEPVPWKDGPSRDSKDRRADPW